MARSQLKWNQYLIINDLFGVKGATAELSTSEFRYGKVRKTNYAHVIVSYQNDEITVYRLMNLTRSSLECLNKTQGKRAGITKLMNNRYLLTDILRAKSSAEIKQIEMETKEKNKLKQLQQEMAGLIEKKTAYEKDFEEQEKQYQTDKLMANTPISWDDKIVGQKLVGSRMELRPRVVGHYDSVYRTLPDKEPRSSFESPDYEVVSTGGPIIRDVLVPVDVYENITEKVPVFKTPEPPVMKYGYQELLEEIAHLQERIQVGLKRKEFIQANLDRYN